MGEQRDELSDQVRELTRAVAELQARLAVLERAAEPVRAIAAPLPRPSAELQRSPAAEAVVASFAPGGDVLAARANGVASLFGWAFLGIAGAYLLRAVTESGTLPGLAGAAAGIVYAGWWLFLAARKAGENPLASTVHGITAALILAPMLWEVTTRLHLLNVQVASAVLVLFSVWGLGIAWRQKIAAIAWTATLSGVLTAGALFRETHDAAAWAATTLIVAAVVEFSACRDHWLGLRWVVAIFADLTVLGVTFLLARPGDSSGPVSGTSAAWVLAAQIALVVIYLASAADRSVLRKLRIEWFEICQPAVAFLLLTGGALHVAKVSGSGSVIAGLMCLAVGLACYGVSSKTFDRERRRNYLAYSVAAVSLVATGCWMLLSGPVLAASWGLTAVITLWAGAMYRRAALRIHGVVYLLLAAVLAELLTTAYASIVRTAAEANPAVPVSYMAAFCAAVVCYAVCWRMTPADHWTDRYGAVICAGLMLWGVAGLAAHVVPSSLSLSSPARTALLIVLAVGAGWMGRRSDRVELVWLVYPLLATAGFKLLAEDFRTGRSMTLFLSLILFGGALLLLPRLLRTPERRKAATA